MNALIVTNAYMRNSSQISQAQRVGKELEKLGVRVFIEKNVDLARICGGEIALCGYDFCVFLDKDRVAARLLEGGGLRLYNSAEAVEVCDDKMLTHIALAGKGINMPDCIYAPLCYTPSQQPDGEFLKKVSSLGFPLVAKQNYGSLGAGVKKIADFPELATYEAQNIHIPHFYQRFIDCGGGEDLRVIVIGGKYLCAMRRRNEADFRSNIELGGKGENYEPDSKLIALCERVAKILGLDYCGIDILTDKEGKRYVCEVNSNAFFAAAERVCGVNVAAAYAKFILSDIQNNRIKSA